jgi:ketopantoate reductase
MAQDLARGRRTEADAIVGSVARAGAAAGVGTPVIDSLATQLAGAEAARVRA